MVQRRTVALERLAESLGIEAALALVAFYDGKPTAYVPERYRPSHILERVVGEAGFLSLVAHFGGETIEIPKVRFEPERRLGAVYRAMRDGMKTRDIADQLGITFRRVRQIERDIQSGGPLTPAARRA